MLATISNAMQRWSRTAADTKTIHLQISNFCNLSCPGCSRATRLRLGEQMNDQFLDLQLLQQSFVAGQWPNLQRVVFSGNIDDPSMHPQLFGMITHWLGINDQLRVLIHTNGSTRTARWYRELGLLSRHSDGRLRTVFAIDGLEDTNHIYRIGSDWQKLQQNWRAYIGAGGMAFWQFVVFEHNQHQLAEIRALHSVEGFQQLLIRYSGRDANDRGIKVTQLGDYHSHASVTCKALTRNPALAPEEQPPELFINHLGEVSPCCFIDLSNTRVRTRYETIISDLGQQAHHDLHHASVEDIVSGDWFAWLHTNMQTNTECVRHCQHNLRDRLIIQ